MSAKTISFEGRAALVTGAGSGIGAAAAKAFAEAGAMVCCADINRQAALATAETVNAAGGRALACEVDVADERSNLAAVHAAVSAFGRLDVVYLNAGVLAAGPLLDTDVDTWERVMGINLRGVFLGLKAAVPALRKAGGGAIAVTASTAGLRGDFGMGLYTASKHGVVGLVKCAAAEFAPDNIRVNAVAPGAVATPMVSGRHPDLGRGSPLANMHPIGRVGQPEDIADLVLFLCSDLAGFVTGGIYPIDGGITAVANPRFRGDG
jgi:NAD(P)-dependent dehydrogenase (short-subunit alcohol dehydrogenase family)